MAQYKVIFRQVSHALKERPKIVFSMRLSEEDIDFLHSIPNASEFIRCAIEEEKRKQRMLEAKGLPFEIIHEIADTVLKTRLQDFKDERLDLDWHTKRLSDPLFTIAKLTLKCPDPYSSSAESITLPSFDDLIEELQSKEAKAFIQKLKDKVEYDDFIVSTIKPLDEDELETVRKIYGETKMLLEQAYRKTFHKLPPDEWYLTIIDGRSYDLKGRIRYQVP
jgi:hypothetical protein